MELALLTDAAQLDHAGKLQLAIDLLPAGRVVGVNTFMDAMTALRTSVMARGRTALLALSDEEWDSWIGTNGGNDVHESV